MIYEIKNLDSCLDEFYSLLIVVASLATAAQVRRPFLLSFPVSWMRLAGALLGKSAAVDRLLGSLCVDITPLREELGWTPPYTMQAGLDATAHWYRKTKANQ
jgi:nucleoside-diphosphate-sugar epimerase